MLADSALRKAGPLALTSVVSGLILFPRSHTFINAATSSHAEFWRPNQSQHLAASNECTHVGKVTLSGRLLYFFLTNPVFSNIFCVCQSDIACGRDAINMI